MTYRWRRLVASSWLAMAAGLGLLFLAVPVAFADSDSGTSAPAERSDTGRDTRVRSADRATAPERTTTLAEKDLPATISATSPGESDDKDHPVSGKDAERHANPDEAADDDARFHSDRVTARKDRADAARPQRDQPPTLKHSDTVVTTKTLASPAVNSDESVAAVRPARKPPLVNVLGSKLLTSLMNVIRLFDGPPTLPPGSTVSVRSSTLTLSVGKTVDTDWYFPKDADQSTRLIYLQHGFLATGPMYSYTAARLAERTNSIVVVPTLSSNFFDSAALWVGGAPMQRSVADLFSGDRAALGLSASTAAGHLVTLPQKFALVGHSAGGTVVTAAAGYLADTAAIDDLVGVVMLDGVEPSGSHAVNAALAKLQGANDRPIYLISSQRYFWSRDGDMADKLQAARPDRFNGLGLQGGLHIDYMQGGNSLLQAAEYLTAGFSKPANIGAANDISAGWIDDLFSGTHTQGVYGTAGQAFTIDTPSGSTVATVFPLAPPMRSLWYELLEGFFAAVFNYGGNHVFVYEPTGS